MSMRNGAETATSDEDRIAFSVGYLSIHNQLSLSIIYCHFYIL